MNRQQLQSEAHLGRLACDMLLSAQQALIEVRKGGDGWQAGFRVRGTTQQLLALSNHAYQWPWRIHRGRLMLRTG